jgi:hypothetical protein
MHSRVRRKLAAGAAVTVFALGGALAAMAATGSGPLAGASHSSRSQHGHSAGGALAKAAGYLGLSTAQLRADLHTGRTLAQVARATPGKSEAGLIAVLAAHKRRQLAASAARLTHRVTAQVRRPFGPSGMQRGALFYARAYLGLTSARLRGELRSGMTLGQIADATKGRSQAGLIQALVGARMQALSAALAAGTLSASQEQARAARLDRLVTALVQRKPARGRRRRLG